MSRERIPGISAQTEVALQEAFLKVDKRLSTLERVPTEPSLVTRNFTAREGQFIRVQAPPGGILVQLPPPRQSNRAARITFSFETKNPTAIQCNGGRINGETQVIITALGTFEAVCDGQNGWSVALGVSSSGSPTDAHYIVGTAHGSLPNAAVATDTTYIDVAYTPGGNATWTWQGSSVQDDNVAQGNAQTLDFQSTTSIVTTAAVAGGEAVVTHQRAALTGDVAAAQNSNSTTIQPDVVDNTKLTNMAARRIKGRADSAGTGDPQDLTGAQVGAIIRFGNQVGDPLTTGSVATYTVAAGTNQITFNSVSPIIHGISIPAEIGQRLIIQHIGSGSTTLVHESASAGATGERLRLGPYGANVSAIVIKQGQALEFNYDNRWLLIGSATIPVIADDTFLANTSGAVDQPSAKTFTSVTGDGLTYDATNHEIDVNGSTSIVVTSDQVQRAALTGAIAASQNSNATVFAGIRDNGSSENDRTNLNFVSGSGTVATVTDDAANDELEIQVSLAPIADDTFLANVSGGADVPTAKTFASTAGDGLSYDATNHEFDVNGSTSIVVSSDQIQRAALTGAVSASQNSNATTFSGIRDNGSLETAQPFINFVAGTNTTATVTQDVPNTEMEVRVNVDDYPLSGLADQAAGTVVANVTAGSAAPTAHSLSTLAGNGLAYTNVTGVIDVGGSTSIIAGSSDIQRAALAGAISASQNSNATVFSGIRDNGSSENDRTNLNFLSTTSNVAVVTDDAGNDELEITYQRAALTGDVTASQNSNSTAFRTFAAKSVLSNATNSSAVPSDLACTVARHVVRCNDSNTGLEWGYPVEIFDGEFDKGDFYSLNFAGSTGLTWTITDNGTGHVTLQPVIDDLPLSSLDSVAAKTVIANATNASAPPTAVASSTARHVWRTNAANDGLEWGYPIAARANSGAAFDIIQFNFLDGTHTTASLGGTATDALFQYNLDVPSLLAAVDSTSIVVSSSTLQRAALTGAVSASQNSNATLFAGVEVNSVDQTARSNLNLLDSTTITWTGSDSAVNDRINVFADRAALTGAIAAAAGANGTKFAGILDNGSATTDRTSLNLIGFTVADDAGNDRINITAPAKSDADVVQSFTTAGLSSNVQINTGTTVLRVDTGNSAWSIDGFVRQGGNVHGDSFKLMNASNSSSMGTIVTGGSSASTAGNTISTPGNMNRSGMRYSAVFEYDGTDSLWRIVSEAGLDSPGLQLSEIAEASVPSVSAGKGLVWLENNAPNSLMFSNDGGDNLQVVAVGQPAIGLTIANDGVNWKSYQDSHITTPTTVVTNSTTETNVMELVIPANSLTVGGTYEMMAHCIVTRGATLTASNLRVRMKTGGATSATFNGDVGLVCQATTGTNQFTVYGMWKADSIGGAGVIKTHGILTSELPARTSDSNVYMGRGSGSFNTGSTISIGFSVLFGTAVSNLAVVIESGYIRRTG